MLQAVLDFIGRFRLTPELIIFCVSAMPLTEIKGGLIAARMMNEPLIPSFIISYTANLLPVPFILLFIKYIFEFLRRFKAFSGIIERMENKAISKSESIKQKQYIGLLLFTMIPIPGTGVWVGSLICSMLNMDRKKSFGILALGLFFCGVIMVFIAYVIPSIFL